MACSVSQAASPRETVMLVVPTVAGSAGGHYDTSGRWIGFNGDIHLVEGLSLGGSVRGLRINLDTGAVSLDGVAMTNRGKVL